MFAWPGGYPIVYLDQHGCDLCVECANKNPDDVRSGDVHWEGAPIECDECGRQTESAYGEVEEGGVWSR